MRRKDDENLNFNFPQVEFAEPNMPEQLDQLTQAIAQAESQIQLAGEKLNELFLAFARQNMKENPYATGHNLQVTKLGKKIKGLKKNEDHLLKTNHLKGRFRAFAKVYHSINKKP